MNTLIGDLSYHLQSAQFAAVFLDALLKSLIVLALAGSACVLWRKASSATRHLIWFLAVASLPCLPLIHSTAWQKPAWAISTTPAAGNQISLALELAPKAATQPVSNPAEAPKISSAGSTGSPRKVAAQFNAHWMLFGWLAWLAGSIAVLIRIAGGQFHRRKFSRTAQPPLNADWTPLLRESCATLNLRREVMLLQSTGDVMPMTWGWWRPVVLLPAEATQWPAARRRVVLLHELAHVKRRDYLTQNVAQLVCALYWFNPLVWFAARQMRIEREGACDDLVLTGGCKASDYASHLVEIAGSFRRVPQMAAIAMARSSQLEGRIAAIVDGSRNRRVRSAAAVALLALITGVAVCLGSGGLNLAGGAGTSDGLRQQQLARLMEFSKLKEKQSEALAAAAGETISPEFQKFFDAAMTGDWQSVTNLYEGFKQRHPQYSHAGEHPDESLRTSYWGPVLEISMAYDHVVRCEPDYTQMAVDGIINSIPPGSIYFGGTDPGRGLPTAFCKSQPDADPFYTLTQNALADGTYLEYLRKTYGPEKELLGQLAEACRTDVELQGIRTNSVATKEIEKLESELAGTERELAEAEKESDPALKEAAVSDLQRKAKIQRDNLFYFESTLRQANRDERVKAILAEIQKNPQPVDPKTLYIPTGDDAQRCFQEYVTDASQRWANHQLKPNEDVKDSGGRTQISGQVAVMQINGLLVKVIFDKNPGHEFYIEESFPLDWMAPYLEPHGLIMKINREPLAEISDATVKQDREFWQPKINQMIGGWLKDDTSISDVAAFAQKVFLKHDLRGFTGDARFVQNDYSCRMFSKLRLSIAGLYAWRAENATAADEKDRMARAADFAFRQALALCPSSAETADRYAEFLKHEHRGADAQLVADLAEQFKPKPLVAVQPGERVLVGSQATNLNRLSVTRMARLNPDGSLDTTPTAAPVFQIRLALDVPTDNTEPMRLASAKGSSASAESLYVTKAILLDQASVESAKASQSPQGYSVIDVSLTDAGRKQFAEITRQYLHQRLAIVIDGTLWNAPVVQTEITGGEVQITGSFSETDAKDLAAKISAAANWTPIGNLTTTGATGAQAVVVTAITPLYLTIALDSVNTNESGAVYVFKVARQAAAKPAQRAPSRHYVSQGDNRPNGTFAMEAIKGPADNPDALRLKLVDSGEEVTITRDKPYRRVDGYAADFRYDPEKKVFHGRRVNDKVHFSGADYTVADVTQSELILMDQSTQEKTSLPIAR